MLKIYKLFLKLNAIDHVNQKAIFFHIGLGCIDISLRTAYFTKGKIMLFFRKTESKEAKS